MLNNNQQSNPVTGARQASAQGLENIVECFGTRLSYMIFPKTNSKVVLSCDFRSRNIQSNINNDLFIRFGISSSLWNAYADY